MKKQQRIDYMLHSFTKMSVAWLRLAELADKNRESQSPGATKTTQLSYS